MKKTLLVGLLGFLCPVVASSQVLIQEGFEGTDSIPPPGWHVYNNATFQIDPATNWVVYDTSRVEPVPGLATGRAQAHSGTKAIGVSWWASIDSGSGATTQSDAWLITPMVTPQAGDSLRFWGSGGSTSYLDSLQIWVNGDSLPSTNGVHLGSIIWPIGSTYGQFSRYAFSLVDAIGVDVWIGFRYFMDCTVDGFFVWIDDVHIGGPVSVHQVDPAIPDGFSLSQNYPNPFNPGTTIEFALPRTQHASLKIFNAMGEEVATLVDEALAPGTYRSSWDGSGVASGMYFYRLQTGNFVQTRKLLLVK
jgi:hypothetical protein